MFPRGTMAFFFLLLSVAADTLLYVTHNAHVPRLVSGTYAKDFHGGDVTDPAYEVTEKRKTKQERGLFSRVSSSSSMQSRCRQPYRVLLVGVSSGVTLKVS